MKSELRERIRIFRRSAAELIRQQQLDSELELQAYPYRSVQWFEELSADALANELSSVVGLLGLSHYRGSRLTEREYGHGRDVIVEAIRRLITEGIEKP